MFLLLCLYTQQLYTMKNRIILFLLTGICGLSLVSCLSGDEYDYTQLEFDVSTGRITAITIPTTYDESTGEPIAYTTIDVSAATVTDETAYQDAYNQYEYDQYLYDKAQQEINAKTEIIQQEDRNLELKLQRLDNERTQITTEIEAVDKVINDNIESSYKTFSG